MNLNIFGGFQKNDLFGGYGDFVDIFWDHHKIGLYLGVISMHFRVFYLGQGREWGIIFWVAKFSNNLFGVLEIPDIFWGGPEPTYEEKNERTPHPTPPGPQSWLVKKNCA